MINKPTGIIRTLPTINGGRENFERSLALLKAGHNITIYVALQSVPKNEVLHLYLLVEGFVVVRMNIAGYEPGDARRCWDGETRQPKFWALCTAPVSLPPEPIKMRGFQGFHYTEDLW